MVSMVPFAPRASPISLLILMSQLVNPRVSENFPVRLSYEIPPEAERDERSILLLEGGV